jgi:hypothetical protein
MLNLKSLTVAGPDPAIQPPRVGAAKEWIRRSVRDSSSPQTRSGLDGRVDALPW